MVLLPYSPGDQARFAEPTDVYWACRNAYRAIGVETSALGAEVPLCA